MQLAVHSGYSWQSEPSAHCSLRTSDDGRVVISVHSWKPFESGNRFWCVTLTLDTLACGSLTVMLGLSETTVIIHNMPDHFSCNKNTTTERRSVRDGPLVFAYGRANSYRERCFLVHRPSLQQKQDLVNAGWGPTGCPATPLLKTPPPPLLSCNQN